MKRPWVVKAGGELMASDSTRTKILKDLGAWNKSRPVVFVHGGGPQIEAELTRNNVKIEFVNGRRVTSPEAMVVVERVLSGQINKALAAQLERMGTRAVGLSSRDGRLIVGKPLAGLGRAAKPERVNTQLLWALLKARFLPVVSSVGSDKEGEAVNINADDAASAIASALKAERLVFLTDISGVQDKNSKRIVTLKTSEIDLLIQDKVIKGGMIPKVQAARSAIRAGVKRVSIANGFQGVQPDKGTTISK